eukprot:sb/3463873/
MFPRYVLVKEFRREHTQFQSHVFRCRALRPAVRNVNPSFANKAALCFPLETPCTTDHPYTSEEDPRKVKVILEERNVFCGQYHQQHLLKFSDTHRTLHYCRGRYVAVGSKDRKVQIRNAETGKLHKTIVGHAGSIKSLLLIEKFKIVISGSYDLTIRAWSIETGAYLRLWRGHRGTITCLDHNETIRPNLVSVICPVNIQTVIANLQKILPGNRAGVGTESKFFHLWDVDTGTKLQIRTPIYRPRIYRAPRFTGEILYPSIPVNQGPNITVSVVYKVYQVVGKVYCVSLTPHFILTGSQNVLYVWNMLSLDTTAMFTLPHPRGYNNRARSVTMCPEVEEIPDQIPCAPPSSPEPEIRDQIDEETTNIDLETIELEKTTVRESARQFSLFTDQFVGNRTEQHAVRNNPQPTLTLAGMDHTSQVVDPCLPAPDLFDHPSQRWFEQNNPRHTNRTKPFPPSIPVNRGPTVPPQPTLTLAGMDHTSQVQSDPYLPAPTCLIRPSLPKWLDYVSSAAGLEHNK